MTDPDPRLLEATTAVLAEHGWAGLTLERIAAEAGMSRPTLWRQGVTRDALVTALLARLAEAYRDAMWTALTADGSGRERLERAINALFDVADEHLLLLAATDTAFHEAGPPRGVPRTPYIEPIVRLLRDGLADGTVSLSQPDKVDEAAVVLFNIVWTYVHLRSRHGWSPRRTRNALLPTLLLGLTPRSDAG